MNRHERRAAASKGEAAPSEGSDAEIELAKSSPPSAPAKPGILLRIFGRLLLSHWIIDRVKDAQVEQLLISLALQSGRGEIADQLLRRQALRQSQR